MALYVAGVIFMALLGLDILTALGSVAATIGNIGPGLGTVGPTDNYAHIPATGKWVLSFMMLAGRLEIYPVIILITRSFWKKLGSKRRLNPIINLTPEFFTISSVSLIL